MKKEKVYLIYSYNRVETNESNSEAKMGFKLELFFEKNCYEIIFNNSTEILDYLKQKFNSLDQEVCYNPIEYYEPIIPMILSFFEYNSFDSTLDKSFSIILNPDAMSQRDWFELKITQCYYTINKEEKPNLISGFYNKEDAEDYKRKILEEEFPCKEFVLKETVMNFADDYDKYLVK